ncbi:MAG: NAD(P)H-hydrate dehydratase [Saprospiraceae bacterium]|nr:NAD(P)H-hydrate dehydratase [Saprospiraceae bacterium]MCF8252489.1 NAD(P)H-hydrate dehydratase [Saprospiraceae bacterium]MCF8282490.1 NAD(P)H-hydrate dehydratase [Bacteroidales bacterium]MCF8312644.1 NAD(P)H-hydrate dehydratase [Saprospiraceae bacterium]MCF8441090.1 NAD(P)H-hydrate dehydratase [Saprospiraceae bacterium]
MKIFNTEQIRRLDAATIQREPITSHALMERASKAFCDWFAKQFLHHDQKIYVLCGIGNNGGDGLAISRLLAADFYDVYPIQLQIGENKSADNLANLKLLEFGSTHSLKQIVEKADFPVFPTGCIIIDAVFGSGLNKPVTGYWADFFQQVNQLNATRVAVDIPSGMFADQSTSGVSIHADWTFSFEMPKRAFFFAENQHRLGNWTFGSIGLDKDFIENEPCCNFLLDEKTVKPLLRKRHRHDHKGSFGHALLVAGSYGKIGAAILAARACLRSGAGLVTVHAPKCGYEILQIAIPEAMVSVDEHQFAISNLHEDLSKYKAIGIGCGIDTNELTAVALADVLQRTAVPVVLDADALNLLAGHPDFFKFLPKNSILTPHLREFERMFGPSANDFERNDLQLRKAKELGVYLILKGANTAIATPAGDCFFNNTGNPGMATGGSGDVLTGILTGLLAQGYPPLEACQLGVYLHGLAGDLAMNDLQQEALLASDITDHLGKAFKQLKLSE